jgi:hypothetical protein
LEVITTVITYPYHFYSVFVQRVSSNEREMMSGMFAFLNQILCCHEKKS